MILKQKKNIMYYLISIVTIIVLILTSLSNIIADDRTVDGWGVVKDQNGVGQVGVRVEFYKCFSPTKRVLVHYEITKELPYLGYYDWDLSTDYYDIIVKKGTADEGGFYNTYCPAGQWPNLVRNITFGTVDGSSTFCPNEEEQHYLIFL
jgi:hypothetical protein